MDPRCPLLRGARARDPGQRSRGGDDSNVPRPAVRRAPRSRPAEDRKSGVGEIQRALLPPTRRSPAGGRGVVSPHGQPLLALRLARGVRGRRARLLLAAVAVFAEGGGGGWRGCDGLPPATREPFVVSSDG